LLSGFAQAQQPVVTEPIEQWLTRLQEAARHRSYTGTFVVTAADRLSSARIWHVSEGAQQVERIDALSGEPRTVFRHNDAVLTLLPQSRLAITGQRQPLGQFPEWLRGADSQIGQYYSLRPIGVGRAAGWLADVSSVSPRDHWRFGYRVWVEPTSGVVLKLQIMGDNHEVLEQAAFSELELSQPLNFSRLIALMSDTRGYRVKKSELIATSADQEGWSWRATVPGFRLVSCHKQDSVPVLVVQAPLQCVLSDGLASVSVFLETFNAVRHHKAYGHEALALGATRMQVYRTGLWWLTVVGEVPAATLGALASGFERKPE
jgi:sigma-E factor negative regulatory protein RseB